MEEEKKKVELSHCEEKKAPEIWRFLPSGTHTDIYIKKYNNLCETKNEKKKFNIKLT